MKITIEVTSLQELKQLPRELDMLFDNPPLQEPVQKRDLSNILIAKVLGDAPTAVAARTLNVCSRYDVVTAQDLLDLANKQQHRCIICLKNFGRVCLRHLNNGLMKEGVVLFDDRGYLVYPYK